MMGLFYFMTYAEKLKDPRWQKKRLEVMQRDEFTCQFCKNFKGPLHVHHKTYEYNVSPWDYEDSNFITLCEDCHKNEELQKIYFNLSIKYLLKNGITYFDLVGIITDTYLKIYTANEQKGQSNG